MLALNEGIESDNFIRVMVVGNFNQGKTSLTRRLLGLELEGIESTDGIDIHSANCNLDDITWTKAELHTNELNGAHRLAKVVKQNKDSKHKRTPVDADSDKEFTFSSSHESDISFVSKNGNEVEDNISQAVKIRHEGQNGLSDYSNTYSDSDSVTSSVSESAWANSDESADSSSDSDLSEEVWSDEDSHVQVKDINLLAGFSKTLKNAKGKDSSENEQSIHVNIWDFGGQFIYYATHQIFHSKDAIYLLVFDLTKDLDSIIEDDDFPDQKTDLRTCLKFWVGSVHAFVGTEDGNVPKIILVGTHKADFPSNSDIEDKFDKVLDIFIRTKARNHIYTQPFAVENTDPDDRSITEIKKAIFDIGLEKAKSSKVPAKWIQLEVALNEMRHVRKLVKFKDVVDLDASTDSPIKDELQLKIFLKYHHAKGTLVYFDEDKLREFVVIDPQFLVDAFKCIITSKRFCKWRSNLHDLWEKLMETAVLEKYLLNKVWEQDKTHPFMEHRDILLAFLQRLRILAETLYIDEVTGDERGSGKYIVPSLLKVECSKTTLERALEGKKRSLVILGLSLENTTILKTIFERVTAAALGRWPPLEIDGQNLVFQSTAFYLLDLQHAGIISNASDRGVEITVFSQCPPACVENVVCDRFRRFVETVIANEFQRLNSERKHKPFSYYIKCNHAAHGCKGSKKAHCGLDDIKNKYRVCCPDNESHAIITKHALAEWFHGENVAHHETALKKKVTEKDLGKIAQAIGEKWELLGPSLGLNDVDVQRIKMDHRHCTETAIYYLLISWKKKNPVHDTMQDLVKAMKDCDAVVNWDKINNILDEF
ncbi:probable serine/threonine-protein kinase roco6 [Mercenaria mercenaria]|uniref:probable serine/threonine-protein kinase roco6 n=1 Tax=Mercenaria mercenaria TaxID=6596 RepID=UPI00234F697E|nr:probable serine/threonine-protein kinase roco6 [Mercenaria mercenaria]